MVYMQVYLDQFIKSKDVYIQDLCTLGSYCGAAKAIIIVLEDCVSNSFTCIIIYRSLNSKYVHV